MTQIAEKNGSGPWGRLTIVEAILDRASKGEAQLLSADNVKALLQAERKQTLEQAAKAVCWYCLHGVPMANAHYHAAASMGEVNPCSASAIHALIAELGAETREVEGE